MQTGQEGTLGCCNGKGFADDLKISFAELDGHLESEGALNRRNGSSSKMMLDGHMPKVTLATKLIARY